MNYPISDNYIVYNKSKHRYILTVDCLKNIIGNEIQSMLINSNVTVINSLLDNISSEVYNYVYKHNNTQTLQYIIAKCPSAREIIKEAMEKQAIYVFSRGDLGFSTILDETNMSLNKYAKEIIDNQEVIETGVALSYCGSYRFKAPSYIEGDY